MGQAPSSDFSSITVGIATLGRASILAATLGHLRLQTYQFALIVSATTQTDIPETCLHDRSTRLLLSAPPGLASQRNVIVEQALGDDILVFFDDDFFRMQHISKRLRGAFLPTRRLLSRLERLSPTASRVPA
jgi:glycosyltransferase involved in cell wall biosynthesis